MSTVTFASDHGQSITVLMDTPHPILSGGFGGWETIDRPKRPGLVRFKGRAPFVQDFSILFDGFAAGESQEDDISKLEAMATQPSDLRPPPKIKVSGMAYKTDLWWVIDGLDFSTDVIAVNRNDRIVRLRQACVVHLLEFIDDQVILTPAQPTVPVTTKPVKKITTPDGMTLKQIAQLIYGDPDKWFVIYNANPLVIAYPDPRQFIAKGTPLLTPGGNVPTFTVP